MQVKNLTALFVHCTYQKPLYVWDNNGSMGLDWLTEWMKFSSLILTRLYKRRWVNKGVLWSKSLFSIKAFCYISSHPKHRPLPNWNLCNLCNAHDVSPTPNFSNTNCLLVICIVNWIWKSWLHWYILLETLYKERSNIQLPFLVNVKRFRMKWCMKYNVSRKWHVCVKAIAK